MKTLSVRLEESEAARADAEKALSAATVNLADLNTSMEAIIKEKSDLEQALEQVRQVNADLMAANKEQADKISAMEAETTTVQAEAAEQAGDILARIGVPPVEPEAMETAQATSLEEIRAKYNELLKSDPRAAGKFYNETYAPALRGGK